MFCGEITTMGNRKQRYINHKQFNINKQAMCQVINID